jgi:hypothetical protein
MLNCLNFLNFWLGLFLLWTLHICCLCHACVKQSIWKIRIMACHCDHAFNNVQNLLKFLIYLDHITPYYTYKLPHFVCSTLSFPGPLSVQTLHFEVPLIIWRLRGNNKTKTVNTKQCVNFEIQFVRVVSTSICARKHSYFDLLYNI